MSKTITQNTLFNAMGKGGGIIANLFLTPFVVSHIGIERFGIWALVGVVTGYIGIFDTGIGASYVKFISSYYAKGEYKKIKQVIAGGMLFYLLIGIVLSVLIFPFINTIIKDILNIPTNYYDEAYFVITAGIALFFLSNIFNVFNSVIVSLQRMDISNKISLFASILNLILTVIFLNMGAGLSGLIFCNIIIFIICTLLNIIFSYRLLSPLLKKDSRGYPKLSRWYIDKTLFKEMFSFGLDMQVSSLADIITMQTDRLIITNIFGIAMTGVYQVGASIIKKGRELPDLIIPAILPAACNISGRGDYGRLLSLYSKGTMAISALCAPIFIFAAATAQIVMIAWMGRGYESSAHVIEALSFGYLINVLSGMGCVMAQATGNTRLQMRSAIITACTNITLSVILSLKIGFIGVAVATSISFVASFFYFFIKLHREIGIPVIPFMKREIGIPILISAPLGIALYVFNVTVISNIAGRFDSIALLTSEVLFFVAIYIFFLKRSGYLASFEINLFKK